MRFIKTFESIVGYLISAVKSGNLATVKRVLNGDKFDDINETDNMGWTPLLWATYNRKPKMIKLLIDSGADMNYKALHHIGGTKRMVDFYDLSVDKGYTELSKWIETYYPEFIASKKYNL